VEGEEDAVDLDIKASHRNSHNNPRCRINKATSPSLALQRTMPIVAVPISREHLRPVEDAAAVEAAIIHRWVVVVVVCVVV
jgi:hypothetical protein